MYRSICLFALTLCATAFTLNAQAQPPATTTPPAMEDKATLKARIMALVKDEKAMMMMKEAMMKDKMAASTAKLRMTVMETLKEMKSDPQMMMMMKEMMKDEKMMMMKEQPKMMRADDATLRTIIREVMAEMSMMSMMENMKK